MEVRNDTVGDMDVEEPKTESLSKSSSPPDATDDFESQASKKKARAKSPAPPRPKTPTTQAIKSSMTKSSAVIAEIKKRKLGNADMSSYRFDSSAKSPALNVVTSLAEAGLTAGRELNEAVSQRVENVLDTCELLLLEVRSVSEAREEARELNKKELKKRATNMCPCGSAAAMLPKTPAVERPKAPVYDEISEDQTDKSLLKLEASLEKLRDLAGMIQKTSIDKEAELIQKVTVSPQVLLALSNMIDRSQSTTCASAPTTAFTSAHVAKLENWYGTHPKPYSHELCTMSKILKLPLYSSDAAAREVITESAINQWFNERREREVEEHIQAAIFEAQQVGGSVEDLKSMQHAAADDIRLAIDQRIESLRHRIAPNAIIEELEMLNAKYAPKQQQRLTKRKRDDDKVEIVKLATTTDIMVIQNRLDGLLSCEKTPEVLEQVHKAVFLLRSLLIPRSTIKKMGLLQTVRRIMEYGAEDADLIRMANVLLKVLLDESGSSSSQVTAPEEAKPETKEQHKFSDEQLAVLEQVFQGTKTIPEEESVLSAVLDHINSIRDATAQAEPFSLSQIIKWFHQRHKLQYASLSDEEIETAEESSLHFSDDESDGEELSDNNTATGDESESIQES